VELKDIKVGERYAWHKSSEVTVKCVEADCDGYIAAMRHVSDGTAEWVLVQPQHLSPIVRRYTVELRPPKAGERYRYADNVIEAVEAFAADEPRWVIVDGDQ
jgi:hypothetical protein